MSNALLFVSFLLISTHARKRAAGARTRRGGGGKCWSEFSLSVSSLSSSLTRLVSFSVYYTTPDILVTNINHTAGWPNEFQLTTSPIYHFTSLDSKLVIP